jgi:hypothetical protein
MNKYHLVITSSDTFGMGWLQNIIDMANLGAVMKEGTIPRTSFPHVISMVLEAETPPTPSASLRVFEFESNKEVFAAFVEPVVTGGFSMETEDKETTDKSTNEGKPWTKEQLDSMDWETEFKEVCKSVGITGRSRDKMTKEYLAKFA